MQDAGSRPFFLAQADENITGGRETFKANYSNRLTRINFVESGLIVSGGNQRTDHKDNNVCSVILAAPLSLESVKAAA